MIKEHFELSLLEQNHSLDLQKRLLCRNPECRAELLAFSCESQTCVFVCVIKSQTAKFVTMRCTRN